MKYKTIVQKIKEAKDDKKCEELSTSWSISIEEDLDLSGELKEKGKVYNKVDGIIEGAICKLKKCQDTMRLINALTEIISKLMPSIQEVIEDQAFKQLKDLTSRIQMETNIISIKELNEKIELLEGMCRKSLTEDELRFNKFKKQAARINEVNIALRTTITQIESNIKPLHTSQTTKTELSSLQAKKIKDYKTLNGELKFTIGKLGLNKVVEGLNNNKYYNTLS